jgi:S-DNA-T family DNA segregation ATPase FtsK/SpoIIIE
VATGNNSTYNKGSQSNTRSKTTASRSTSTARSPQKARSSQSSRQASASRTGGRKTKAQLAQEQARKNEIHLFICLAVCTFFFISNFGWCGVVGNFFAKFMFGLFGVMEYIFCVLRSICVLLVGICATIRLITTITARTITVIIEE